MAAKKSPIRIKKIGHVVFSVKDIEASTRFWTEIMGFHVTDRNERGMVFFRNATDHHTIALAPADKEGQVVQRGQHGFDHIAFEVATVSELFKVREFIKSQELKIIFEGRRGPGGNPGVEFISPDGFQVEVYAAMDQIGTDGRSRPANEWNRATTLEEAVANPLLGAVYD